MNCVRCGGELPEGCGKNMRYCSVCFPIHRRERENERRAEQKAKEKERREKVPSLAQLQREAQALGMSYGQYMVTRRTT